MPQPVQIKVQVHEQFRTFKAQSVYEAIESAASFASTVAAKSFAVFKLQDDSESWIVTIGFKSGEHSYPVKIELRPIPDVNDDDLEITVANITGDVLCHSLFFDGHQTIAAFLVHAD